MMRRAGLALSALGYGILLEAMLVAAVLFWPEFLENLSSLISMARSIPIAGDALGKIDEQGLPAYIVAQHFFKGCNALGTAAAVLFAAPAVAGEAHRGTLELWLARPFSRNRILLERWGAGALALVVPIFLTTLTIPWLCERVDEYVPYGPYLLCALHQSLFLLVIYSITFLASCLGSNPIKTALIVLFVAVFQFAIFMVKTVTHTSLYRLCDMDVLLEVVDEGRLDVALVSGLVAANVLLLGLSLWVFRRRTP